MFLLLLNLLSVKPSLDAVFQSTNHLDLSQEKGKKKYESNKISLGIFLEGEKFQ